MKSRGALQICAIAASVACYQITDPPAAPKSKGVTTLTLAPAVGSADGVSIVSVDVMIDTAAPPADRKVDLATTLGSFLPSGTTVSVIAIDSGVARAQLRAPSDSGVAIITASAAGVTLTKQITFLPAVPTRLQLSTRDFSLKRGPENRLDVTALLLRSIGTPTAGSLVTFTADTTAGTSGDFGQFANQRMLATNPTVTTQFSAATESYIGRVLLRARASRGGSITASDSVFITIVP